ncbi:MAG TPA: hypothetical protein VF282_05135 [Bacillota bacterium]
MDAGVQVVSRTRFLQRLAEFEAGYVVGHLGGVGVWFQLLTALVFTHEETGEERLLLGEAFVSQDFTGLINPGEQLKPRNACIVPWDRITALKDDGRELLIELADGRLRIVPAGADPGPDWLER